MDENIANNMRWMYRVDPVHAYMVPRGWRPALVYLDIFLGMDAIFQALNRAHQVGTVFQQDLQVRI